MFRSKAICLAASVMVALAPSTACLAAEPQLNFKIYSPQDPPASEPAARSSQSNDSAAITEPKSNSADTSPNPVASPSSAAKEEPSSIFEDEQTKMQAETPKPAAEATEASGSKADGQAKSQSVTETKASETSAAETSETKVDLSKSESKEETKETKTLQGYVRVVPTGTKIPIVMDTAVDSDTSQEGDEFSARTSEDLNIDGSTIVPAGSIIKGRIATLNAPRAMSRSGSVALKFDTITTPDNRQIPLVANLVARGGVVHARRGLKDVAIDAGTVAGPMAAGLLIGLLAGKSSSSSSSGSSSSKMGKGGAAALGAGIGLAVGIAVLLAKKGKKVEVRPGDELKIELAEELRMPTM